MKLLYAFTFIFLSTALIAQAQLRDNLHSPEEYSATVTHTQSPTSPGNWMNMLNMSMSHSYSMSFSNFGGQAQNINAYTNSMQFDISERMDAMLDISVLHSPFGNSFMNNSNSMGAQIVIDRARFDYKLSPNTRISLEFSNNPYYSSFGHGPFGYRNSYNNPFNRRVPGY